CRGDGARLARRAAGRRRAAVTPVDRVGPRGVVRARVAEAGAERDGATRGGRLVWSWIHRGYNIRDRGGGRGRGAGGPMRVGDGERDGVAAVVGVRVARSHAGARAAVAEVPGIRQGIAVGIGRAAAVEADGRAFGARVGSACGGAGRPVRRSADRHGELSRARYTVFVCVRLGHSVLDGEGLGV